jgi:hypothetical protein
MPKEEPVVVEDHEPPVISIISPEMGFNMVREVTQPEMKLIGKVTDNEGVSSLIVNGRLEELSKTGVFASEILLNEGMNEIPFIALDENGNLREVLLRIDYVIPVKTLAEKIREQSTYYGLIIGVDNYMDPVIQDLDNPVRDAESLYEVLVNEYTFDDENITFLKDATREDIITAFDALSGKVTPSDNVLIFYAGHGWWDDEANNGFWLPADARNNNKIDWFRNSTLVDYLKEVKSKHTLLITDACFGGAIFKTRSVFMDAPKAIEMLYEMKSRKAMTSGTLTEVPDHSAFVKYLVERLKENEEKYLSSEQLFSSFRIAVMNNSDAVPQYGEIRNVGDQGGDFIFIKK